MPKTAKTPRRQTIYLVRKSPADQALPPERHISQIFEFKITLKDIKPMIWRRVQVPKEFSFQELHFTIQAVMGWRCNHAFTFHVPDPDNKSENVDITSPDMYFMEDDDMDMKCFAADQKNIADFFKESGDRAVYEYDHGDSWEHNVVLEKIVNVGPRTEYPKAISGKRACPPEDSGGSGGYTNLLKIIKNPNHADYGDLKDWLDVYDEHFDSEKFDRDDVDFDRFKLTCVPAKVKK